jgi:hypothetical protein
MQQPTLLLIHLLVTRIAVEQRAVHVEPMRREIEADETLEHHGESRKCAREVDDQACRRTSVSDHIKHGTELQSVYVSNAPCGWNSVVSYRC